MFVEQDFSSASEVVRAVDEEEDEGEESSIVVLGGQWVRCSDSQWDLKRQGCGGVNYSGV